MKTKAEVIDLGEVVAKLETHFVNESPPAASWLVLTLYTKEGSVEIFGETPLLRLRDAINKACKKGGYNESM